MSMELFDRIILGIKPYYKWIEMVSVYGRGEPLLDNTIGEKIKKLHDIEIRKIQISTNASLLTKNRAEELFANGLNDLRISIDSIRKDRYEYIRKGLRYDTVITNVLNTIKVRNESFPNVSIRIRAVEMDINKDEKEEWLHFWQAHLREDKKDLAQFITYRDSWAGEERKRFRSSPCVSPFSTMVICTNGDVKLCCETLDSKLVLGNLHCNTIQEIWNNEKFKAIRKLHLECNWNTIPACYGCTLWEN